MKAQTGLEFPIDEPFTSDSTNNTWVLGGAAQTGSWTARLTGTPAGPGGVPPAVPGWLQLTNATANISGYAVLDQAFPSNLGVVVDFQYAMYGGQPYPTTGVGYTGDGFSFYLIDGRAAPSVGRSGSGLGYACAVPEGTNPPTPCRFTLSTDPDPEGVVDGYVGVGFDAYGGFSANWTGSSGLAAKLPNQIAVRGSGGISNGGTITPDRLAGYSFLTGTTAPGGLVLTAPQGDNTDYGYTTGVRNVRIAIVHAVSSGPDWSVGDELLSVWSNTGYESDGITPTPLQAVITNFNLSRAAGQMDLPPTLKLGFAASTGGATNVNEIRNLLVTPPTDLSIEKEAPDSVSRGGAIQWTLTATNHFTNEVTNAVVVDDVPAGVTDISWACTVPEDSGAECVSGSVTGNRVTITVSFPAEMPELSIQIVITGTVIAAANSPPLTNDATITAPDTMTNLATPDEYTASTSTTIEVGELTITVPNAAELDETTPGGTTSGQIGPVTVSDYRPGPGPMTWTATVTWTQFTGPGTSVIPPDRISYWSGAAVGTPVGTGNFVPGQLTAGDAAGLPGLGPGGSVIAFTLPPPGGSVDNSVTWNPTLVVSVPYGVSAGDYIGTVLHSVA